MNTNFDLSEVTPKFFSAKAFTGNGTSKIGQLNANATAATVKLENSQKFNPNILAKSKQVNGKTTIKRIPISPLSYPVFIHGVNRMEIAPNIYAFNTLHLASKDDNQLYLRIHAQAMSVYMREKSYSEKSGKPKRELSPIYRMELISTTGHQPQTLRDSNDASFDNFAKDLKFATVGFSFDLPTSIADTEEDDNNINFSKVFALYNLNSHQIKALKAKITRWLGTLTLYELIRSEAVSWVNDEIGDLTANLIDRVFSTLGNHPPNNSLLISIANQLRYLENYPVSLEAYAKIYDTSARVIQDTDLLHMLNRQNINLLMSYMVRELGKYKNSLVELPPQMKAVNPNNRLNSSQLQAVQTTSPLVLLQSGAGTGKSTTVLSRLSHMINCGVKPQDIMVLSFTNAAADNIKEKNPGVSSMTIAAMNHTIYAYNFPNHILSTLTTLKNSIQVTPRVYFSKNVEKDTITTFVDLISNLDRGVKGSLTALNSFICENIDDVISILNTVGQTSLELEVIICYQLLGNPQFMIPPQIQAQHLIVDEVQDNSVFEFIYILKWVLCYRSTLFIVGDASQTLYEFRNANPKALNTLEASNVFTVFKLEINYRSRQAILDFANVGLSNIDANRFSQIQLSPPQKSEITPEQFSESVKVKYFQSNTQRAFLDDLDKHLNEHCKKYVESALGKGEKIAFLSYSRSEVDTIKYWLEDTFPGQEIVSLVSTRSNPITLFTDTLKELNGSLKYESAQNIPKVYASTFTDRLAKTSGYKERKLAEMADDLITEWWNKRKVMIAADIRLVQIGNMTNDQFHEKFVKGVINYEVSINNIRESYLRQNNRDQKEKNLNSKAQLIVSTIHGAKGLEFDNVFLLHKSSSSLSEDTKRLYYVGLTRAKKSELIFSYGSTISNELNDRYEYMIRELEYAKKELTNV